MADPEAKLIKKSLAAANKLHGTNHRAFKHHGSAFSEEGVSDIISCAYGVYVAAEFKAPESYGFSVDRALGKGPSPEQLRFIEEITEAGGVAGVVATVDQYLALIDIAKNKFLESVDTPSDLT